MFPMARTLAIASCILLVSAQDLFLGKTRAATGPSPVPFIVLDAKTGARALDGSSYGFYHRPSKSASTKWTIFMEGGGWCYNEEECAYRSMTHLGSSKNRVNRTEDPTKCTCFNDPTLPITEQDCQCLFLPYMDGASFSGYREAPVVVKILNGSDVKLWFRGLRNLDATLEYAFEHLGLTEATEMVVSGASAGGLATYLHVDRISELMRVKAPKIQRTIALPIVGYFLDHPDVDGFRRYSAQMEYVVGMQNVSDRSHGGPLNTACVEQYEREPHRCSMAPIVEEFNTAPTFAVNSKFDAWQVSNILSPPCYKGFQDPPWERPFECDAEAQTAIEQYGKSFIKEFQPFKNKPQNGGFITSCIEHGSALMHINVNGTTLRDAYSAWYSGQTTSETSWTIDPSSKPMRVGSNGDPQSLCLSFP